MQLRNDEERQNKYGNVDDHIADTDCQRRWGRLFATFEASAVPRYTEDKQHDDIGDVGTGYGDVPSVAKYANPLDIAEQSEVKSDDSTFDHRLRYSRTDLDNILTLHRNEENFRHQYLSGMLI